MSVKHPHNWGPTRGFRPPVRPDLDLIDWHFQCSKCGCYNTALRVPGRNKALPIHLDREGNEISRGDGIRRNTPHCIDGKPIPHIRVPRVSPPKAEPAAECKRSIMVFSDLNPGDRFITSNQEQEGTMSREKRYLLVKIPVFDGNNVIRLCDGNIGRVDEFVPVIPIE